MKYTVQPRDVTEWLTTFGEAHAGTISGTAAGRAGIGLPALRWQVDRGTLLRLTNSVFRLRGHPPSWEANAWAAIFDVEPLQAYVSHRSAGRLHGLWAYRDSTQIEVCARRGRDHETRLSRFHATSLLDADHVTVVDGIPCTTLARTLFDLCGDPDRRPLRSESARATHRLKMLQVTNDAIRHHGLEVERELAVLAAIGKRGRSGTALVRELFEELGCNYVPADSDLEIVFLELCRNARLPLPEKQVSIDDAQGFIGRVDFLFPPRLVVEIDSSWHDGPLDIQRDAARDDRLRALGYIVRRWRWRDLVLTPEKVIRRIRTDLERSEPAGKTDVITSVFTAHSVLP